MGKKSSTSWGDRLRAWRDEHGLTQIQLRDLVGVREIRTIRNWESASKRPADRFGAIRRLETLMAEGFDAAQLDRVRHPASDSCERLREKIAGAVAVIESPAALKQIWGITESWLLTERERSGALPMVPLQGTADAVDE